MKQPKRKPHKPYKRKLYIDGEEWSWQGSTCVKIANSDGSIKYIVSHAEITGLTQWSLEKAINKHSSLASVTPRKVADYIKEIQGLTGFD